jgi:hypothetical protein
VAFAQPWPTADENGSARVKGAPAPPKIVVGRAGISRSTDVHGTVPDNVNSLRSPIVLKRKPFAYDVPALVAQLRRALRYSLAYLRD